MLLRQTGGIDNSTGKVPPTSLYRFNLGNCLQLRSRQFPDPAFDVQKDLPRLLAVFQLLMTKVLVRQRRIQVILNRPFFLNINWSKVEPIFYSIENQPVYALYFYFILFNRPSKDCEVRYGCGLLVFL